MVVFLLAVLLSGLFSFCSKRKHLLLTLLSIEFMVLGLFFMMFHYLSVGNFFFSLIFLAFTACEGALGLGLLINMSRSYGGDYFNALNFSNQ